jgi:hypothetical protein
VDGFGLDDVGHFRASRFDSGTFSHSEASVKSGIIARHCRGREAGARR